MGRRLTRRGRQKPDDKAPFIPSPRELSERADAVRRSWFDPELRAELGLKPNKLEAVGLDVEHDEFMAENGLGPEDMERDL